MTRQFNLKGEWLVEDSQNVEADRGRMIYPEKLRMAEPGWVLRNCAQGERKVRPEDEWSDDERRAVAEWVAHVEAGRIG